MDFIVNLVAMPLLWLHHLTGSYAAAVFLFTVVINLLLLPLRVKQQKTMAKQAALKPKLEALREKYGDNKQKFNMEMGELYQKNNVSMTGGCLVSLIQLPLLMLVYSAIQRFINEGSQVNFNFFGIDLSQTPKFNINIIEGWQMVWLIPILSFATAMLSAVVSMLIAKKTNPQAGSMGLMMLTMPVVSLFIAFGFTAALGFYWACSNLMSVVIQLLINQFFHVDSMVSQMYLQQGKERRKKEQEIMEKMAAAKEAAPAE